MKIKDLYVALVGASAALSIWGGRASATPATFTLEGVGSGTITDGAIVTPFNDKDFVLTQNMNTKYYTPLDMFGSSDIVLLSENFDLSGDKSGVMLPAGFNLLQISTGARFGAISFSNYDAPTYTVSAFFVAYGPPQPTSDVNYNFNRWITLPEFTLADGSQVAFTGITDSTFQFRVVPEPATWAMMLVGLGGIGAAMRMRRKLLGAFQAA
jgi:hypothetical protein